MKPSELLARIDERQAGIEQKLEAILIQTTKTNGRVSAIEERTEDLETYQGIIVNDIGHLKIWKSKLGGIWFTVVLVLSGGAGIAGLIIGVLTLIK